MRLAKVIGSVVATVKDSSVNGMKILLIVPIDDEKKEIGQPIAALDTVHAGPNDLIYYVMARESTLALSYSFAPVDAVITGIVDQINNEGPNQIAKDEIF